MKTSPFQFLIIACFLSISFSCGDDNTKLSQDGERTQLNDLKTEIEKLASTSVCDDNNTCKYLGLGSKPCGGPWEYLIYSTSIDTEKLEQLVKNYNQKEKAFNIKWGAISDCAVANPPSSIKCENNICIAVY